MGSVRSGPPEIAGLTFTRVIGGGGFADVFLYLQHSTNREVAVKVLRAEHLGEHSLERFRNEADVMARVSTHPFIVTVLDAGVAADGRPHIVMEHYPGPHFGLRARRREFGIPEVLRVGIQVASAVETAHRAGILHRDVKPANILTSEYGSPGLTDFGVAGVQSDTAMAAADAVSPGFTAPEVLLEETATGTRASDVYALGATLYALIAGRSPLWVPGGVNDAGTLLRRAATGEITATGVDGVPARLELLLRQCLDPEERLRPDGAVGLAQALQDIEQSLSLSPTPLALVGLSEAPPVRSREVDTDATVRRPRTVDPEAAPDASFVGPAPGSATVPVGSEAVSVGGVVDLLPTVLRTPPSSAPVEEPGPTASGRPSWLVPVIGGVVGLIALVGLAFATGSGGESGPAPTTTVPLRSVREDPVVAPVFGSPAGLTVDLADDGGVELRWSPPDDAGSIAGGAFSYDVFMDGDVPLALGVSGTAVEFDRGEVHDDACFDVYAVLDTAVSPRPSRVCLRDVVEGDP